MRVIPQLERFGKLDYGGQPRKKMLTNFANIAISIRAWASRTCKDRMPHQPILPLEPFQKWVLDFWGPFKPPTTRTCNQYIIVATDYCTKWVKAKALHDNTAVSIAKFVYEYLWCQFGFPIELVSDQGGHFLNLLIRDLTSHYDVVHKRNTPYYPQSNGMAESMSKTQQIILKKIMNEHWTDWDNKWRSALWAYNTAFKTSIGSTPFRMAFGLEALMNIEFQVSSFQLQVTKRLFESESKQKLLEQSLKLEDEQISILAQLEQGQRKRSIAENPTNRSRSSNRLVFQT